MKKIIYLIIIFNFLLKPYADASIKDNIITNFKNTQNLSFEFKQNINEKTESGKCIIEYRNFFQAIVIPGRRIW